MENLLMQINEEITIPAFGRFVKNDEVIKLVGIKRDFNMRGKMDNIYCFNNGVKLCTHDLEKNIELWNSRR